MWEFICQQNIYRRTYKIATLPTGLDGVLVRLERFDAS